MAVTARYTVDDVERAIEFYRDRLGFAVDSHPASTFAALRRGQLRLYLSTPEAGHQQASVMDPAVTSSGVPSCGNADRSREVAPH